MKMEEMKKLFVEQTLIRCNGNKTKAAAMMGISVRALRNYVHQYDLHQFINKHYSTIASRMMDLRAKEGPSGE